MSFSVALIFHIIFYAMPIAGMNLPSRMRETSRVTVPLHENTRLIVHVFIYFENIVFFYIACVHSRMNIIPKNIFLF